MAYFTVCTALVGRPAAFALMYESLAKYHDRDSFRLYVYDGGESTLDGRDAYAESVADRYFAGPAKLHGPALDFLCSQEIDTGYAVTVDNDVEFLAPVLPDACHRLDLRYAGQVVYPEPVEPLGTCEFLGSVYQGMPRIDPCCSVWNTNALQQTLEYVSWGLYANVDSCRYYDVGAMLYATLKAQNEDACEARKSMREAITHYGMVTWGHYNLDEAHPNRIAADDRYALIEERLKLLREDGLTKLSVGTNG